MVLESVLGLVVAILLSLVAGEAGAAEESTRFAASGAFLFAIAAFVAALGVRRQRAWAWTLGALLQLLLAVAAGVSWFAAGQTAVVAAYLAAFALAAITMIVLSTSPVRRALGQA